MSVAWLMLNIWTVMQSTPGPRSNDAYTQHWAAILLCWYSRSPQVGPLIRSDDPKSSSHLCDQEVGLWQLILLVSLHKLQHLQPHLVALVHVDSHINLSSCKNKPVHIKMLAVWHYQKYLHTTAITTNWSRQAICTTYILLATVRCHPPATYALSASCHCLFASQVRARLL